MIDVRMMVHFFRQIQHPLFPNSPKWVGIYAEALVPKRLFQEFDLDLKKWLGLDENLAIKHA